MYPHVFVAGTFDGLHKGHEFLLYRAFQLGEQITIGVTSDKFIAKFKAQSSNVKIFASRKKDLEAWLTKKKFTERATIVPIDDPFEPAASYKEQFTLLVSTETRKRADVLNQIRKKRGLPLAILIEVPMVNAEDGKSISSTRVRNGEIDGSGRFVLPDSLRPELQQPLGRVLHGAMISESLKKHEGKILVAVGDVATKTLLDAGITPSLIIIDNRVERKPYTGLAKWRKTVLAVTHKVKSGPGYIAHEAIELIRQWSRQVPLKVSPLKGERKQFVIEVDGEEDLLALPAIVDAPAGAIVYYGQPQNGLVEVLVTLQKKKKAVVLLRQFI